MKGIFSIDRAAPPKNPQEAISALDSIIDTFPTIKDRILNLSDDSYIDEFSSDDTIYQLDLDGNISILDTDDIDDIDDPFSPYYDDETEYYNHEDHEHEDYNPFVVTKHYSSPAVKLYEHIKSLPKNSYTIYQIIYLCQHICEEYRYPLYEDIKESIPIDFNQYKDINESQIDDLWKFNSSVTNYLLLQYIYRKSIHVPAVSLKELLQDINFEYNNDKIIDSISSNFSSRRAKIRKGLGKHISDDIFYDNQNKIKEFLRNNHDAENEYKYTSTSYDSDVLLYVNRCIIKIIADFAQPKKITATDIKNFIEEYFCKSFSDRSYIGTQYNNSWINFSKNTEFKWHSIFDFLVANGIYFGKTFNNPFYALHSYSFEKYLSKSKFNYSQKSEHSFIKGFLPRNINLSVQDHNFITMFQYVLERITNINLINSITSICPSLNNKKDRSSDYHRVATIADNASILAKYPLVNLRPKFLIFMQNSDMRNHTKNKYIYHLIRHQIYLYFPLLSRVFQTLLSLLDLSEYPTPNAQSIPLFNLATLEPVCKYCSPNNYVCDAYLYDESIDDMRNYFFSNKVTYIDSQEKFNDASKYIKMRIYYSYYSEIRKFNHKDFAKTFKEYPNHQILGYIHNMDN